MSTKKQGNQKDVFSGEDSRELWAEINSLNDESTGEDIQDVLFSIGCAMQRLECKFNKKD